MSTVVVLAMHGVPPSDFPRGELLELLGLEARLGGDAGGLGAGDSANRRESLERRFRELDEKLRGWPRTSENDRFHAASLDLGARLGRRLGLEVVVAFNEFCAPSVDEALERAAVRGATRVMVATAMMTPGGAHAEVDIPAAIARARERHPSVEFVYAWPFDAEGPARFLEEQIKRFL